MTVGEALAIVQERLRSRERNFLAVLERGIFGNPRSPYRALLDHAGYTLDDVRELVSKEGLEGTLERLRRDGVYVSFEEFKGTQPIVRGSITIDTTPADFDNPGARRYYSTTTGGSTGAGRRVQLDLEHFERAPARTHLVRYVHGVRGVPAAAWSDLPPGGGLKGVLLQAAAAGERPTHWFCAQPMQGTKWPSAALSPRNTRGGWCGADGRGESVIAHVRPVRPGCCARAVGGRPGAAHRRMHDPCFR